MEPILHVGLVEFSWNFFFQIANTLIIFLLLRKFLFKPVKGMLDRRKEMIATEISDAEELRRNAEELKLDYDSKIKDIKIEAEKILQDANARAEQRSKEIIAEAQDKTEKMILKAQAEIERQNKNAYNELKNEVASMAIMAAERIIGERMDDQLNEKLIIQFMEEAGDVKWQN